MLSSLSLLIFIFWQQPFVLRVIACCVTHLCVLIADRHCEPWCIALCTGVAISSIR